MKKIVFLLATLLVLLPSCSQSMGNGRVTPVALTEHEKLIVSAASDTTLVFDYEAGKKCKWITFSLDEYKFGEKVQGGGQLSFSNELGAGKGTFILVISQADNEKNEPQKCTLFASSNATQVHTSISLTDALDPEPMARAFGTTPAGAMPDSGSMTLAAFAYTSGTSMPVMNLGTAMGPAEMKSYDVSYILTCTFSEEQPEPNN